MWATIIGAIIAIAGTAINAGVQSNETEKAQNEARGIAGRNRASAMKQQGIENRMARSNINMQKQSQQIDEDRLNFDIGQQQKDLDRQIGIANTSSLNKSANKVLGTQPQEDSFLYKRSLLNRIS